MLNSAYRTLIAALPEGVFVPVSRELLLELLGRETVGGAEGPSEVIGRVADYSTREIAAQFGKAPSTVRAWCEQGRLPGAYLRAGKEWRIPVAAVRAMQEAESRSDRQRRAAKPSSAGGDPVVAPLRLDAWRRVRPGRDEGTSLVPPVSA